MANTRFVAGRVRLPLQTRRSSDGIQYRAACRSCRYRGRWRTRGYAIAKAEGLLHHCAA